MAIKCSCPLCVRVYAVICRCVLWSECERPYRESSLIIVKALANSVTSNPTWTILELNPDPSCERFLNNRLSSDTAYSLG